MKNLLFIIMLSFQTIAQQWNNTVETNIYEPTALKIDLYTNSSGNHLLLQRENGNIVYYKLNSQGQLLTSNNPTPFSINGSFPNITGSKDVLYAIYKEGSNIKGKYSIDGGTNWSNLPNISMTTNLCNGVDAVYEENPNRGVHIVWATRDNYPYFETYYFRLPPIIPYQWVEFKNVTDHNDGWRGGKPSVSLSSNRVHISFNTETGISPYFGAPADAQTRDKVGSQWEDPQLIVYQNEQSTAEKTITNESNLFLFYSEYNTNGSSQWRNLNYKTRGLNDQRWSEATELAIRILEVNHAFNLCHTLNNDVHLVYDGSIGNVSGYVFYQFFSGSNWSFPIIMNYDNTTRSECSRGFTNVSNDLFLVWTEFENSNILFRQYDAAPLVPQNLTAQPTPDYHPKLIWNNNLEPDIQKYYVYRSTNLGYYSYLATVNHNSTTSTQSHIDYTISVPRPNGQAGAVYYYVVSAVDLGQHISGYSNYVAVTSDNFYLDKTNFNSEILITEYNLEQNYPNPFNPTTTINYQIKDAGLVTLKIYDILGKEVAELVSEVKESGKYSVNFDASNLPSGVYIYSLKVNDFVQNHKMTLMK